MKIIIRIFLGLFILGFCIVPIALYFVIPAQATKILKTPVKIKSVYFNPTLLTLDLNGLEILDSNEKLVGGFKLLHVNVSFLDLIKGKYHVEKVVLDGLRVNALLQADGNINLMTLVTAASSLEPKKEEVKGSEEVNPKEEVTLPLVVVDKVIISDGEVNFKDESVTPQFKTQLHAINIMLDNVSTDPLTQTRVTFDAKLDQQGIISNVASLKPLATPLDVETTFKLNAYALTVLSPYIGKYTGNALKNGQFDLTMSYRISNNKINATHKIVIQDFKFGDRVESKEAIRLPYSLVIGLLEDPKGRIKISLPVQGDMSDPKFDYWSLVGQVVRNFFTKIITRPFSFLASMIGISDESSEAFGSIRFMPGQFELSEKELNKLQILTKGLTERPRLKLKVNGSYDPVLDWKAIQTSVFKKDYSILRADSEKSDSIVYRQLYQRRFGLRALWQLAKEYKISMGQYEDEQFNQAMRKQLIENASADKGTLEVLGQARAQAVYNQFIALGFDPNRLVLGGVQEVVGTMGEVPLEFAMEVIE